jgi:hypothetical protein
MDMGLEAARKLVEDLDANIREENVGNPHFSDPSVHPFPLAKEGFRLIREARSGRKIAFVDGGNQEIIGAPNFSVQLNRIYAGVWNDKEKVNLGLPIIEFFSATFSTFKNDEIYYETVIVPGTPEYTKYLPDSKDLSFNSYDRSVMNGNQRADIDRVASIARRFAEWKFASLALKSLTKGDVLVMDGTIQTNFANEGKYLKGLVDAAKEHGVVLSGLSKTSALFTTTGLSLLGAVNKLAEDYKIAMEWYYPIAESSSEDHNVMIIAVKLNTISERVFRYEIHRDQFKELSEIQLNEILTGLVKNSSDATFPGYPYGLIDADRFARVSYNELEYYRGVILSQISELGKWGKFSRHIRAGDAHSILNMLAER